MSRILFNDGSGSLGAIAAGGVTDNTGGNYTLVISAATWKEANFEERDLINIESGNTDLFEIEEVDPATRAITVQRKTGSQVPAAADVIFMQGSENNDPQGLKGVCDATSGTLYNIPVGRRWQATQVDASAATISSTLINQVMLAVEKKVGKAPKMIMTSYKQYEKFLNTLENQKRYNISPRDKDLKGKISFSGIEVMTSKGPIGIFPERFCEDDRMYFLNDDHIEIRHRPDFGWFDDDGTVFLRKADSDAYEARYGGYMEVYINPAFQGVLTNLSVA